MSDAGARVGLGTYRLGPETYRVCRQALELGYRHIDTASLYRNEQAVGDAVRESGIDRDEITITSKVWVDDIRAGLIAQAVSRSVRRTGRIDIMLLHAPVGDFGDMDRSWQALLDACHDHDVALAGVSNYQAEHLDVLSSVPAVNQIEVSPFWPRAALVERCVQAGTAVTAHSPLAKAKRLDHPVIAEVAAEIDVAGDVATPAQVMLAWSCAQGLTPLPRTQSPERLAENLHAAQVVLRPDQHRRLGTLADGFATHPQHR